MITYNINKETKIIETEETLLLRKGYIHKSEIVINKETSSTDFMMKFQQLLKEGQVSVDEYDAVFEDFEKLQNFGFLVIRRSLNHSMHVYTTNVFLENELGFEASRDMRVELIEQLLDKKEELSKDSLVFVVAHLSEQVKLREINRFVKDLGCNYGLICVDNGHIFATYIAHGRTGCYECFEQQLISRFEGRIEDYQYDGIVSRLPLSEMRFVQSILENESSSFIQYGQSLLEGNILYFNLNQYDYHFDVNRIQTTCPSCAGLNNVKFEEQNMRSINILKELRAHD